MNTRLITQGMKAFFIGMILVGMAQPSGAETLWGMRTPPPEPIDFPFVDEFGQFIHDDWPGKIHSIEELLAARDREEAALANGHRVPGQDEIGGWIDGPQLEATGWFRTEMVDGKWWLVTPEGRLFISVGLTCVDFFERTYVEGREEWFEWIPPQDDPDFGEFLDVFTTDHSSAEPIDGEGFGFSFYLANLVRKYGSDWEIKWQDTTFQRFRTWGLNTIAAWSNLEMQDRTPVPFTGMADPIGGVPVIEASGSMPDFFHPNFPELARENTKPVAERYADNPLCIGFFADNEMPWRHVRQHTLASPPEQPARQVFIEMLQEKYETLDAVNEAWGTDATSWDTLRRRHPREELPASREDHDAFVYAFASQYYRTVRDILKDFAPNHLYLGDRLLRHHALDEDPVLRAAAEYVDVISINIYRPTIDPDVWNLERSYGKPIIIGEFHFGALDRGMFHAGLEETATQEERAAQYAEYVRSVAENPAFVGCHWFQYMDQPNTGRWFDAENYNIGFVTITDTPYPELVEAATAVHGEIYSIRGGQSEVE